MLPSGAVKKEAKNRLCGKWLTAIIASTILIFSYLIFCLACELLLSAVGMFITVIFALIVILLLIVPITMGVLKVFWALSENVSEHPILAFYYFSNFENYLKTIKLFLIVFLKTLPLAIVFHLPMAAVWLFSKNFIFEFFDLAVPLWASNLENFVQVLFGFAQVFTLIYAIRFYIAPVLLVADENMDPLEAINMSEVIAKKTGLDFVTLIFSLLGWIISCVFIMPLPFVLPYVLMCYVVHTRFAVDEYNDYVQRSIEREIPTFTAGAFYEE